MIQWCDAIIEVHTSSVRRLCTCAESVNVYINLFLSISVTQLDLHIFHYYFIMSSQFLWSIYIWEISLYYWNYAMWGAKYIVVTAGWRVVASYWKKGPKIDTFLMESKFVSALLHSCSGLDRRLCQQTNRTLLHFRARLKWSKQEPADTACDINATNLCSIKAKQKSQST